MRQIIPLDMDEFFAAVEKLDNPSLRGKCLLVGGSVAQRGVVSTASYEARVFGCRSAMAMAKAVRLCPHAIILPGRYRRYDEISEQIFAILGRYSPQIEPLSIDEAFLDVTGCERLLGSAEGMAADMKRAIRRETGLTASVGVAPNKFLAKLGSDLKKPDGLVVIAPQTAPEILDPLPVRRIWGVGPAGEAQFAKLNIRTIGQVRTTPLSTLRRVFGDSAEHFLQLSQGLDDRPVTGDAEARSIGQEHTFAEDIADMNELRGVLLAQVEQVGRRLRRHALRARGLHLKLRYGDFTTLTRAATLKEPTDVTDELWRAAAGLLEKWAAGGIRPLRLLGMTAGPLTGQGGQLPLFEDARHTKLRQLDRALDDISSRFGPNSLRRGAAKPRGEDEEGES